MVAETERLIIRDFEESDWRAVHVFRSDPEVARYMDFVPETEEQAQEFVKNCIFHNQQEPRFSHNCAIVLKDTQQVIGWIGFGHPSDKSKGDRDFGYALNRAFWNRGYMTEALRAVLAYCFEVEGVQSVFGECYAANAASARVMEKVGMRCIGEVVSRNPIDGPSLRYVIRADDQRVHLFRAE